MGPRHFSRGKKVANLVSSQGTIELQWGHGISAVESPTDNLGRVDVDGEASMGPRHFSRGKNSLLRRHLLSPIASMGPRHFSRGKMLGADTTTIDSPSFNGATAFQPWKVRLARPWKSWN